MKNIIITGANGFTGSHILENMKDLARNEYNIIASCRTKSKLPKFYNGKTLIGDLLNEKYIVELTKKADTICHTASWAEMNGNIKNSTLKWLQLRGSVQVPPLTPPYVRFSYTAVMTKQIVNTITEKEKGLHLQKNPI